jgi:hypothetical protein
LRINGKGLQLFTWAYPACLVECWWRDRLDECEAMFRESDYRSIPRLVLAGWAFDLFDVPTIAADGGKIQ